MNDAAPPSIVPGAHGTTQLTSATPAAGAKGLDPAKAFAALGNPLRWSIYQMLADGRAMSASEVAAVVKRDFDGVSKHLRLMRAAGVLVSKRGEDRRLELYYIPETIRRADGVADLGFCVIRFPQNKG
ncbi:MAG: winged helix-turn-helix transcriptional regulator [Verrucomicrobiaceae bacterium]|nr:winged helix-turn-helix transcriptional regulator [Verrucomicrobiaceae bacterium]